jgi:excisionase family DNA binding protein
MIPNRGEAESKRYYTPEEAAQRLGVSTRMIYKLMNSSSLRSARFGRCRRIPLEALAEFEARCTVPAQPA